MKRRKNFFKKNKSLKFQLSFNIFIDFQTNLQAFHRKFQNYLIKSKFSFHINFSSEFCNLSNKSWRLFIATSKSNIYSCSFYSSRFSNKIFKIFSCSSEYFDTKFKFHHQFFVLLKILFYFSPAKQRKTSQKLFSSPLYWLNCICPPKNIANIRPHPGKHFLQHRLDITLRYIRRFPRIILIFPEKSHLKNFSLITRLVSKNSSSNFPLPQCLRARTPSFWWVIWKHTATDI